jgi:hypothetical protein
MNLGTRQQAESVAVPLQIAVLCVDCECVTNGRRDQCQVCGSRSLISLAKLIGGTQLSSASTRSDEDQNVARFDVEFAIVLKKIQPKDLSGAVESISSAIGPWLVRGRASCHIDVAPALDAHCADEVHHAA